MRRQLINIAIGLMLYGSLVIICIAQQPTDFVPLDPKIYDQFLGDYQLPSGELIVISRSQRRFYSYEPLTGRSRGLDRGANPQSDVIWFAGPSLLIYTPVQFQLTFVRNKNGEVPRIIYKEPGHPDQIARKVNLYQEERVSFRNGDATLSGTLLIPHTKGPHPAAVFIHGSGAQDRNGFVSILRFAADHFARHGIAALVYDKRGVGQSTGNWATENFDDLAGDALAGLKLLQNRKDIDPQQVGMYGSSQGGWIMAKATQRSREIAFIICISGAGAGITVGEQVLFDLENQFRAAGFTPEEIKQWIEAYHLFYKYLRAGEGSDRNELDSLVNKIEKSPKLTDELRKGWLQDLITPIDWKKRDQWFFLYDVNFDPVPLWGKYEGPVLGVFGELDGETPVQVVVPIFTKALIARRHNDFNIAVFPKAHHIIMEMITDTINDSELDRLKRYVPGYYDTITDWLLKRVTIK
jgi:pimeloyl-ACP methyl ester carboxylesterase